MSFLKIDVRRNGNNLTYVTRSDCGATAQLQVERHDNKLAIKHTKVDAIFRGQGIGKQLLEACVLEAKIEGLKIYPECSYAANQFQKNPEWSNLLVNSL